MMPDRIGTIGKMQGVKPSRMPPPKKLATISQKLPERSSVGHFRAFGFRRSAARLGAALFSASAVRPQPSAAVRLHGHCLSRSCACDVPGFHAANVRSKLLLLGG